MGIERDSLNLAINVDSKDANRNIKDLTDAIKGFEAAADQASKAIMDMVRKEEELASQSAESAKRVTKLKNEAFSEATQAAKEATEAQKSAAEDLAQAEMAAAKSSEVAVKALVATKRQAYEEAAALLDAASERERRAAEDVERATEKQIKASRELIKASEAVETAKINAAKESAASAAAALREEQAANEKRMKVNDELAASWNNIGKVAKETDQTQDALNSTMTKAAVVVTAVNQALSIAREIHRSLKEVIDQTTNAYAVQEKAELDLANALKINGEFTQKAFQNFRDFASEMQRTSTISDETTLGLLKVAKALRLTDQESKDAVTAAAALSAVTGDDLKASFDKVTKTFGGMAGELAEKLPAIKNLTKEQLAAGGATKVLIEQFGEFIKVSRETFAGKQLAAANAFKGLLESIGHLFVDVFDMKGRLEKTEQKFLSLATSVDEFRRKLVDLINGVNFQGFIGPMQDMGNIIKAVLIPVLANLAAVIAYVATKALIFIAAIGSVVLAVDLLVRNIKQIDVVFRLFGNTFTLAIKKMTMVFGDFVVFVISKFKSMIESFNQSGQIPDAIAKPAIKALGALLDGIFPELARLDSEVDGTIKAIQEDFAKLGDKGLIGGFVDLIGSIQKTMADPKFGTVREQITEAGNKATKQTRAMLVDNEKLLRLLEERKQKLKEILDQNRQLQLEIMNFEEDERTIAENNLKFALDAIDRELVELKEKQIVIEKINALGQVQIVAGQDIVAGLEEQKKLLIEITMLNIETVGEKFARLAKAAIVSTREIYDDISQIDFSGMFDSALEELEFLTEEFKKESFSEMEIDFAGNFDALLAGLQEVGKSFVEVMSDPNQLADIGGAIIDAFDVSSEIISDAIEDTFDTVSDMLGDSSDFILSFDKDAIDSLKKLPMQLVEAIKRIPEFIGEFAKAFKDAITEIIKVLPQVISQIIKELPALLDAILDGIGKLIEALPAAFAQLFEILPDLIAQIFDALPDIIEKLLVAIPQIVAALFKAIPEIITNILDRLPEIVQALITGLIGAMGEIIGAFIETFIVKGGAYKIAESLVKAIIQLIPAIVIGLIEGLKRAIKGIFNGVKVPLPDLAPLEKKVEEIFKKVVKGATGVAEEVFGMIDLPGAGKRPEDIIKDPVAAVQEAVAEFIGKVTNLWQDFLAALKKLWMWIWEHILEPIYNLVKKAWLWVWDNVIEPIVNLVKKAWLWVYENVIMKIGEWVEKAWQFVIDFFNTLAELVKVAWQFLVDLFNGLADLVGKAWQFLVDLFNGLADIVGKAWQFLVDLFNGLATLVKDAWQFLLDFFEGLGELVTEAWKGVVEFIQNLPAKVSEAWAHVIEYFNTFGEKMKAAWQFLIDFFNTLVNVVKGAWQFLMDYFTSFGTIVRDAWHAILDFFQNIFRGKIEDAFAGVIDFFKKIGDNFKDTFESFKKIFKPLEDLKEPFEKIIEPFEKLVEPLKNIKNPLENIVEPFNKLKDAFNQIIAPFRSLSDALNKFKMPDIGIGGGGGGGGGGGTLGKVVNSLNPSNWNTGGLIPRYQNGGGVDSQLAWTTPGEFVMSRNAVDSIGSGALYEMNRTGNVPAAPGGNTTILKIEPGAIVITGDNRNKDDIADAVMEKIKELSLRGKFVIADSGVRII